MNTLLKDRLDQHCRNQCKDYCEKCLEQPLLCGFRTYMLATINDFHFYKRMLRNYQMKDINIEEAKNELEHIYNNSFNSDDSYYTVNNFIDNLEKENEELKKQHRDLKDTENYVKDLENKNEYFKDMNVCEFIAKASIINNPAISYTMDEKQKEEIISTFQIPEDCLIYFKDEEYLN